MKDRFDPLIADRAQWLFAETPHARLARETLTGLLSYGRTLDLARQFEHQTTAHIMTKMAHQLARDVQVSGLEHIPRHGPALIVANHPTGIADGIILYHLIARIRPDLFFYANGDILKVLPQMRDMIVPVEWKEERRSLKKTRQTMSLTRTAIEDGRLGVIFPSGRLAKRRGLKLHERPWMPSAAMIARKFELPVIPINIRARNSVLFYLFDLMHPTLRDITLFHETLNKDRQPFRLTIGEPISGAGLPAQSDEGIDILRRETLALGGQHAPAVSLVDSSRKPAWV